MSQPTDTIRVVHVDDEPGLADLTGDYLEREDDRFDVEAMTSAAEGLDALDEMAVDCIVSDYDMPGRNGLEFLEAVRADHPDLPFILFTGKGGEEVASDAITAGVTDYLQKGGGTDQYAVLANRIQNAVEADRARRAAAESERRLHRVFERITHGFFGVNADWEYTYVNQAGAAIADRSRAELLGTTVWEAFPAIRDTPFEEALRTAMSAQETVAVEEYYAPLGRWLAVTVYPADDGISVYFRDVTERRRREREREALLEFLESLYQVATDPDLSPREKISRLLRSGPEKLDLPYGHLTRIEVDESDPGGGTQTVVEASGDHDRLQPGDSSPLSRSYCRRTIETGDVFAVADAVAAGWEGDPAYETFDLGCYVGTPVTVDGELYGTLFFAGSTPRDGGFTDADRTYVRLMGQLVRVELEREGR